MPGTILDGLLIVNKMAKSGSSGSFQSCGGNRRKMYLQSLITKINNVKCKRIMAVGIVVP